MFSARGQRDKGKGKEGRKRKRKIETRKGGEKENHGGKEKEKGNDKTREGKKDLAKIDSNKATFTRWLEKKRERNVETSQEQRKKNTPVNGYTGK